MKALRRRSSCRYGGHDDRRCALRPYERDTLGVMIVGCCGDGEWDREPSADSLNGTEFAYVSSETCRFEVCVMDALGHIEFATS